MKFSEFFDIWVNENYYKFGIDIGKKGDFYTNVSVGYLFGACLANYFLKLLKKGEISSSCKVVEIGANSGNMLADFAQGIFTLKPEILSNLEFIIIEPHEILRKKQLETFTKRFGDEVRVGHYENLDEYSFDEIFVISNELLDAFSCEVIDGQNMLFVDEDLKFHWQKADQNLLALAKKFGIKKGEISTSYAKFALQLASVAKKVRFLSFDYGEFEPKNEFSLRVFKDHQVFSLFEISNLASYFKRSDLTYSLCFKQVKETFCEAGFEMLKFKKQNEALVCDLGMDEILSLVLEKSSKQAYENATKQAKFLISPEFLGEKFKFIEFLKS
ncbi:SAM-dependent methyltransferase [Campylobacter concisus]|uniref:SAM-dependent methyltransferase n=1 Tax=Campylobacter concisus TaxID=199 RepID=UPI00092AF184|nr:SAM-dependent methyltransferase [Campylobacter concisus]OJJ29096.1 dihydrodipicolinate reductase [Campylobacter concisus]